MRLAKFNAIRIVRLEIDWLQQPHQIKAVGAFVDTNEGNTFGQTQKVGWSPEVLTRISELKSLMEDEFEAMCFAESRATNPSPEKDVGGLGELLGDE